MKTISKKKWNSWLKYVRDLSKELGFVSVKPPISNFETWEYRYGKNVFEINLDIDPSSVYSVFGRITKNNCDTTKYNFFTMEDQTSLEDHLKYGIKLIKK